MLSVFFAYISIFSRCTPHVYISADLAADEDGSSGWFPTPSNILQADSTMKPWPISAQNKL